MVKIKRRTHTDQAREYKPRKRAGRVADGMYRAIHKKNVKQKNRAKNRVAAKSRRVNRNKR